MKGRQKRGNGGREEATGSALEEERVMMGARVETRAVLRA